MRNKSKKMIGTRLFGPPPLLEGEDVAAYNELTARVAAGVEPRDIIEDIWVRDVVDITIEIFRLRRLKVNLLRAAISDARERAVRPVCDEEKERLLRDLWMTEQQEQQRAPKRSSLDWKKQTAQNPVVIKRLNDVRAAATSVLDINDVTARAFVNQIGYVERIDHLTMLAEGRRNAIIREIDRRRGVGAG